MITPDKKAKEIFHNHLEVQVWASSDSDSLKMYDRAKKTAILHADGILQSIPLNFTFWQEVREELEKL